MPATLIQHAPTAFENTVSTWTLPTNSSATPGNTLLAMFSAEVGAGNNTPTPTDPVGGGIWLLGARATLASGMQLQVWYMPGFTGSSHNCVMTWTNGSSGFADIEEYSGVLAVSPFDQTSQANATAPSLSIASPPTLAQADELAVVVMSLNESSGATNAAISNPPSGWTSIAAFQNTGANNGGQFSYIGNVGSTTCPGAAYSWTQHGTDIAQGLICTFKNAAVGGAGVQGQGVQIGCSIGSPC